MINFVNLAKENTPFEAPFKASLEEILTSGAYLLGKEMEQLESTFAKNVEVSHCATVSCGLDALTLGLMALDLPAQSEVLVPANTYIATFFSISNSGHIPVPVEPCANSFNIDPEAIEAAITPTTKAIMLVHLYGRAAAMEEICSIAKKHDLRIIEDCAQAYGARYKNKPVGSWGDIGAFSFFPTKALGGIGDGGAITTSNDKLYQRICELRQYGSTVKNEHVRVGFNSRLSEIEAAFLNAKINHIDQLNEDRRQIAKRYIESVNNPLIQLPEWPTDAYEHVWHLFTVQTNNRDALSKYLLSKGIKCMTHYPKPPHLQEAYAEKFNAAYPITEAIHERTLTIPLHSALTHEDVSIIIKALNAYRES